MVQKSEEGSLYYHALRLYDVPIIEKLATGWIKHFMSSHRVVLRFQTGKLMVSPQMHIMIENLLHSTLMYFREHFKMRFLMKVRLKTQMRRSFSLVFGVYW